MIKINQNNLHILYKTTNPAVKQDSLKKRKHEKNNLIAIENYLVNVNIVVLKIVFFQTFLSPIPLESKHQ